MLHRVRSGFTLIELIIVIAIIVAIAAAAFVAIDPARRLHAARNSTRWADITAVLEAVKTYQADNDGAFPATSVAIDSTGATFQLLGATVGSCASATCAVLPKNSIATSNCGVSGLSTDLRPYLASIPFDPVTGSVDNAQYYINKDSYGILTIGACNPEGEDANGAGAPPHITIAR